MRERRRWSVLAVSGCAALLCSCAYVAPPLPPSLQIPVRIVDLTAIERADKLVIGFTAPAATTDGAVLRRLGEIDLRAGERRIETGATEPGPVHIEVAARDWIGREITVRVRAAGKHGRFSEWSNSVRLKVVPPLGQPLVKADASARGVQVKWTPEPGVAAEYRILKQGPADQQPAVIATVKAPEYTDSAAEYGKAYKYSVQTFVKSGDSEAQSEVSEPVAITPVDRFPPAVPGGVGAIAGISSIDLSWNPDSEPDLQGYYVYRATGDGPFVKLSDVLQAPAYSDRTVESGKRYRYAVSAVDQSGNESERSPAVEATVP